MMILECNRNTADVVSLYHVANRPSDNTLEVLMSMLASLLAHIPSQLPTALHALWFRSFHPSYCLDPHSYLIVSDFEVPPPSYRLQNDVSINGTLTVAV